MDTGLPEGADQSPSGAGRYSAGVLARAAIHGDTCYLRHAVNYVDGRETDHVYGGDEIRAHGNVRYGTSRRGYLVPGEDADHFTTDHALGAVLCTADDHRVVSDMGAHLHADSRGARGRHDHGTLQHLRNGIYPKSIRGGQRTVVDVDDVAVGDSGAEKNN